MITLTNIRCMSESSNAFESINIDDSQLIIESYISSINEAGNDGGVWNKIKKVCGQIVEFIVRIAKKIKEKIEKIIKAALEKIKGASGGKGKLEYYQLTLNSSHPGFRDLTNLVLDQMFANADSSEVSASAMFRDDDIKDAQSSPERAKALAAGYNSVLRNKDQFKFSPESEFWKKEFGIEEEATEYGTRSNVVSGKKVNGDKDAMVKSFQDFITKADSAAERLESVMETCRRRTASNVKRIETSGGGESEDEGYTSFLKAKLTCLSNYVGTFCSASTFLVDDITAATKYCADTVTGVNVTAAGISQEFKDAVDKKKLTLVRVMLKDSMGVDPTMTQFKGRFKYASERLPDLVVPFEDDGEKFNYDKSAWTKKYMNMLMVQLVTNFSKERIEFTQKVVQYVYRDDYKYQKEKIKTGKVDDK